MASKRSRKWQQRKLAQAAARALGAPLEFTHFAFTMRKGARFQVNGGNTRYISDDGRSFDRVDALAYAMHAMKGKP